MRSLATCVLFFASALAGLAQVTTTARMDGVVTDEQNAVVPAAQVVVTQTGTGQVFRAVTDEKGYWVLPSLQTGTYKVTVTHPGFKSVTNDNVVLDAGVPATVNMSLSVGNTTETVEVTAGASVVQTDSATVASTLQGRQINDLPFTSHNVTELIATQPGTQNSDGVRYATINGLPQPTINITIDGINVQDNATKSNPDAMFNAVQPRTQAIEEMNMTTAAAGADSLGEGAVQIKLRHQGRHQQLPRRALRNQPQLRLRSLRVFQLPAGHRQRPHQPQRIRLHHRRTDQEEQAVLLRVVRVLRPAAVLSGNRNVADAHRCQRRLHLQRQRSREDRQPVFPGRGGEPRSSRGYARLPHRSRSHTGQDLRADQPTHLAAAP